MSEDADLVLWDQLASGQFEPNDAERSTMSYSLVVHHGETWYRDADLRRVLAVFPKRADALQDRWARYREVFAATAAEDATLSAAARLWFDELARHYTDTGLADLAAAAARKVRVVDAFPAPTDMLHYRGWRQGADHDVTDDLAKHAGGFLYDDLLNNIVDTKEIAWFLVQPLTQLALDLSLYMDVCGVGGRACMDNSGPVVVRVLP